MTGDTTRLTTTAGELTAGQHIILRGTSDEVCRVDHVHPYWRSSDNSRHVLLLLTEVSGDAPFTRTWPAGCQVTLASPEDVAAGEVASRRARLVAALRDLADDIERLELPVPTYRADFSILPGADFGPWAEYLGTEVRIHPDGFPTVKRRSEVLKVSVIGDRPTPPDPAPVPDAVDALCGDPWHEQPTEPTESCPACGDEAQVGE